MKYLKKFEEKALYESYISNSPILPNVSYTLDTNEVFYNPSIDTTTPNVYEFVDLGLSSGTQWATCNVGATKPEEYGLYFAWGETKGYSGVIDTKQFRWSDYKFSIDDEGSAMSKYNSTDNLTTLELVDDAAYVSNNSCRIPTEDECEELIYNTTQISMEVNGVNGVQFTSDTNDNSIFIPFAGSVYDGSVFYLNSYGFIWSSSIAYNYSNPDYSSAYLMYFDSYDAYRDGYSRYYGFPIRPVKSNN